MREPPPPNGGLNRARRRSLPTSSRSAATARTQKFPDAKQVRAYIEQTHAIYSPQVRWKYSNLALTIAGLIVEAVSGESYADYVQRHIFDPLGMANSSVDRDAPGLATGYGRRMPTGPRVRMPFIDAKAMGPATGITSTVEDMAKFVSLQFRSGSPVLSAGALRQMHRVRMLENDWTRGNAIGFAVNREKDKVRFVSRLQNTHVDSTR